MALNQLVRQRYGNDTDAGEAVASNAVLETLLNHRSCRAFDPEPIPGELLEVLLAAAFSAPSKSDLQQRMVIRVRDPEKQARIAGYASGIGWVAEAPLLLIWCGDNRRIRRLGEWRGNPFANDHLDAFMNAAVDAGIALQAFITAAESVGLGCCPLSEVRNQVFELSRELQLPDHVFPVAGLAVGFPVDTPPLSMRLPLSVTVHDESYQDEDLFNQVADYDLRRQQAEQSASGDQAAVESWSDKRTLQYSRSARADFGRYIRDQGFDLS